MALAQLPDHHRRSTARPGAGRPRVTLTEVFGIGETGAATIVAIVDDIGRFPTRGHFAFFNGTAPLDASSGDQQSHRLNRGGNRQVNKVIHAAAISQIRHGAAGRDHYDAQSGRSKRQLSDVICRRMVADARRETARDGQENEPEGRVTGLHP